MLPISLHALFAALFARIFNRLEHLILLWQTGQLPTPPVRQVAAGDPAPRHPALRAKTARHSGQREPARDRPNHPTTVILSEAKDPRVRPPPWPRRAGLFLSDRCRTSSKKRHIRDRTIMAILLRYHN